MDTNFLFLEFVAVPANFDINSYMSMREQLGLMRMPTDIKVDFEKTKFLAETIKLSPVFSILNNNNLEASSCLYLLAILDDLELIVRSISNPIRRGHNDYLTYIKNFSHRSRFYLNIVIINICQLFTDEVINESLSIATQLATYQQELEEKLRKVGNLDK